MFLLAILSILGPLGTDLNLPGLPTMARALHASASQAQLTISSFLLAYGVSQVVVGAFSDRYGRRPILLWSFVVFTLAGLGCAVVNDVRTLIALRFVHGAGACVGIVNVRAIVRDVHTDRNRAAALQSHVTALQCFAIMAAPLLGAGLLVLLGWRSVFWFLFLTGIFLFILVLVCLPETSPRLARGALEGYGRVLQLRRAKAAGAFMFFAWGAYFALMAALPFVLATYFSPPAALFLLACAFMLGSLTGARLIRRIHADQVMRAGVGLVVITGLAVWAADWLRPSPQGFLATLVVFGFAMGIALPNAFASGLADAGSDAGLASGLLGAVQIGGSSIGVALVAWLPWGSGPSAGLVTGLGALVAGASFWWGDRRLRLSRHTANCPDHAAGPAMAAAASAEEPGDSEAK